MTNAPALKQNPGKVEIKNLYADYIGPEKK